MNNDDIREIALEEGFTLRAATMKEQKQGLDLSPYVYAFAKRIRKQTLAECLALALEDSTAREGAGDKHGAAAGNAIAEEIGRL